MGCDLRHIELFNLPKEGKGFKYMNKVSPLGSVIEEFIGKGKPYQIEVFIQPINRNVYQATGFIKSYLNRMCSKCGWDIDLDFYQKIQEILLSKDLAGSYKKNKTSNSCHKKATSKGQAHKASCRTEEIRVQQVLEDYIGKKDAMTSDWNDYIFSDGVLDMVDFVREVIGFSEPSYPYCGDSQCEHKKEALKKIGELNSYSPFSILKDFSV